MLGVAPDDPVSMFDETIGEETNDAESLISRTLHSSDDTIQSAFFTPEEDVGALMPAEDSRRRTVPDHERLAAEMEEAADAIRLRLQSVERRRKRRGPPSALDGTIESGSDQTTSEPSQQRLPSLASSRSNLGVSSTPYSAATRHVTPYSGIRSTVRQSSLLRFAQTPASSSPDRTHATGLVGTQLLEGDRTTTSVHPLPLGSPHLTVSPPGDTASWPSNVLRLERRRHRYDMQSLLSSLPDLDSYPPASLSNSSVGVIIHRPHDTSHIPQLLTSLSPLVVPRRRAPLDTPEIQPHSPTLPPLFSTIRRQISFNVSVPSSPSPRRGRNASTLPQLPSVGEAHIHGEGQEPMTESEISHLDSLTAARFLRAHPSRIRSQRSTSDSVPELSLPGSWDGSATPSSPPSPRLRRSVRSSSARDRSSPHMRRSYSRQPMNSTSRRGRRFPSLSSSSLSELQGDEWQLDETRLSTPMRNSATAQHSRLPMRSSYDLLNTSPELPTFPPPLYTPRNFSIYDDSLPATAQVRLSPFLDCLLLTAVH